MILSLDLGATNIKASLFDCDMKKASDTIAVPTCAERGRAGIEAALEKAANMFCGVSCIAVSSAGDIDVRSSRITYATDNLPGMIGFDFVEFGKKRGVYACAVNDAQAALLGEAYCGAAKTVRQKNIVMLTLGSGVGGAYMTGGEIDANERNGFGRFGHIVLRENGRQCTCGKRGCAETYLSGRAIHSSAIALGIDGADIFEKYAAGEKKYVEFVGVLAADMNMLLDKIRDVSPFDVCVIGGGVADWMDDSGAFDMFASGLSYPVIKAALGNDAGLYGACVHMKMMRGEL